MTRFEDIVLYVVMGISAILGCLVLLVLILALFNHEKPSQFEIECGRKGGVSKFIKYEGYVCFRKDAIISND
jgi:hypothetical protein